MISWVSKEVIGIVVQPQLTDPHALVEKTANSLRSARIDDQGRIAPRAKAALPVTVAPSNIDRATRILDAVIKGLETRGHTVERKAIVP